MNKKEINIFIDKLQEVNETLFQSFKEKLLQDPDIIDDSIRMAESLIQDTSTGIEDEIISQTQHNHNSALIGLLCFKIAMKISNKKRDITMKKCYKHYTNDRLKKLTAHDLDMGWDHRTDTQDCTDSICELTEKAEKEGRDPWDDIVKVASETKGQFHKRVMGDFFRLVEKEQELRDYDEKRMSKRKNNGK